jgi:hypothetical protein
MSDLLLGGLIGAFIGWNLPQPFWAVYVQTKVRELFKL